MSDLSSLQKALKAGFLPDLDLTVDEWSDRYMIIPKSSGSSEYGPYRTERTPHARAIMRALSDNHPCNRVVCKVASQMFKTQIAMNWLLCTIDQSPSNFIMAMPTGDLQKRISARIDKSIAAVDRVREKVAKPNSRDAKNNIKLKEYLGGSLFIVTAGSSSDLSELPAKRGGADEIDKMELDLDYQGDPIKQFEARFTSYGNSKKLYYYSSPTIEDESRIDDLFKMGTQHEAMAECVHCGHAQRLIFENLILSDEGKALYPCEACGALHSESDKTKMFKNGIFSDGVEGDGETESYTASAMFLPYGWFSWLDLMNEYKEAKKAVEKGNDELMKVFYNLRLARCWSLKKQTVAYSVLMDRAEPYRLGTVPNGGLVLTAAIDTQIDRLEMQVSAWGRWLESWIVAYYIIMGDPSEYQTFEQALEMIRKPYLHQSGAEMKISCTFIDSGGANTQDVYNFVRRNKYDEIYALKGQGNPFSQIIDGRPAKVDVKTGGQIIKKGIEVWKIGTITAKDYLASRLPKAIGAGAIHFSNELPEDYYKQVVSEYRQPKNYRGRKGHEWICPNGVRNEAWDLMTYNLAAAYKLQLHTKEKEYWDEIQDKLKPGEVISGKSGKVSLIDWKRSA